MKDRRKMIAVLILVLLLAYMVIILCRRAASRRQFRIIFREDVQWTYESCDQLLDPLSLIQSTEGITVFPEMIDLRLLGETTVTYTAVSSRELTVNRTVRVIEPLITVIRPEVCVAVGEAYDPADNIRSQYDCTFLPAAIDTSREEVISVTVTAEGEGLKSEKSFSVIVTSSGMVWVVDEPYQPARIIDVWIVDQPARPEKGHWQIIEPAVSEQGHYEEVEVPEQGHWQEVVISPEVPEQGHWETVHHEAVTHQQPVYEEVKVWVFDFSDGFSIRISQAELTEMGLTATQYAARYEDSHPGVTGKWHSEMEKRLTGYQTVVDKPAYDEQIWIVDVPYQPAVRERKWVTDVKAHTERRWVVDVEAQPERKKWVVDEPARDEEGHWEQRLIPEVEERGHWETAA
ncbi:MAG: hypothetical protein IKX74_00945 [Erysipelotrichaceae bacterium]|nr:hypothetical protein [Erysipelotrichaceae bacterium]